MSQKPTVGIKYVLIISSYLFCQTSVSSNLTYNKHHAEIICWFIPTVITASKEMKSAVTYPLSVATFKQLPYIFLNVSKWLLTNVSKYCSHFFFCQWPIPKLGCEWTQPEIDQSHKYKDILRVNIFTFKWWQQKHQFSLQWKLWVVSGVEKKREVGWFVHSSELDLYDFVATPSWKQEVWLLFSPN